MMFGAGVVLLVLAIGLVSAYAAWLSSGADRPLPELLQPEPPFVLIVVPVYNEAALLEAKLENLDALTYPAARRAVVIVDGGSSDGTVALATEWVAARAGFTVLPTSHRNKTAQLNEAVRLHSGGEWILVTDADALLAPDAVEQLVRVTTDERVGVVGARVRPASAHALDLAHFRATDWLGRSESNRGSAGIVMGPCYLARRAILAGMPADTVADDVHVSCRAMLAGYRVGLSDTTVLELRAPRRLSALMAHKFRKADAYLREIVRFLPRAHRIPAPMRAIFLWRAVLLTVVPLLSAAAFTLIAIGVPAAAVISTLIILVTRPRVIALFALLSAVLAAAILRYPFSRQVASFPKISP